MGESIKKISEFGILPLLVVDDAPKAVHLAKALANGGIPVAEVTFRTDAAVEAIRAIAQQLPEVIVGAGTVHTVQQARQAVEAGAQFIVTPGLIPDVIAWCTEQGVDIVPGVVSPADIEVAMSFGVEVCKFFPAEAYGGVKTLKALAGPYSSIRFVPTGGVTANNMLDYLSLNNVAAVGGSFVLPDELVNNEDWESISALCRSILQKVLGFTLAHVGINTKDPADAASVANRLGELFFQPVNEFPGAYFAGDIAEVVKGKYLGAMGHIAINSRDIDRAVAYFNRIGVPFNTESAVRNAAGQLAAIYFEEEIGGFAVHLRRA